MEKMELFNGFIPITNTEVRDLCCSLCVFIYWAEGGFHARKQEGAAEVKQPQGVRACSLTGGSCYGSGKTWEVISSFLPCQTLLCHSWICCMMQFGFHLGMGMGAGVPFAG